ncbi:MULTISPECIES: hypothetical protein [unclassified Bradyrhizobium]|uniref:hypothetical protein n=1 Tax=Bradyrhizobium sp. LCT2 TaxID=2493093 RepID=UPI00192A5C85|nr:hypothetical protein [Bradyrhizobium sp. LCT2]
MDRDAHCVVVAQVCAGPFEDEPLDEADALFDGLLDSELDALDIRLGQMHVRDLVVETKVQVRIWLRRSVFREIVMSGDDDRTRQDALPEVDDLVADGIDLLARNVRFVDLRVLAPERRGCGTGDVADLGFFRHQQRRRLDVGMTDGRPEVFLSQRSVDGQHRDEPRQVGGVLVVAIVVAEEYGSLGSRQGDRRLLTEQSYLQVWPYRDRHGSNMYHMV